jgi:hypothetical protein
VRARRAAAAVPARDEFGTIEHRTLIIHGQGAPLAHLTLLRPPPDANPAAVCQEAMCVVGVCFVQLPSRCYKLLSFNLEMAEFGHLHDADAHVPGAMHCLNSHGFAVTQMDGPDVHDRVASAHGHGSPTIPCILLESPCSFTSSMIAQEAVCVHIWPRWRVMTSIPQC